MKSIKTLSLLLFICLTLVSCKSKKDNIIYTNNDMDRIEFANNLRSVINLNYKLDKNGIQDTFNTIIDDQLAGDLEISEYDLDIVVKKHRAAELKFEGRKVEVTLPLEIFIEKETFISTIKAHGILDMIFESDIEVDSSWNLKTNASLRAYNWIKEPKLNLGVLSIPVESIANSIINKSKAEIGKNIDLSIQENFELRSKMLNLMKFIEEPIQVDSAFNMFVTAQPDTVYMTPTWNNENWIEGQIGVFVNTLMSSKKPENIPGIQLPEFAWTEKVDTNSVFKIQMELDHGHIQSILDDNLVGRRFENDGKEITINKIDLNGYKEKIEIVADVSGDFNGTLVFRGKPVFNNETNIIEVEDLDVKVKTKNILHKAGSWLFKGKIKNSIEENVKFSVQEYVDLAQIEIDHYLSEINTENELDISMRLLDTHITSILINEDQVFLGLDLNFVIHAIIHDFFTLQKLEGSIPKLKN